jgi:hypothetical protein
LKKSKTKNNTEKSVWIEAENDQIRGQIKKIQVYWSIEGQNAQIQNQGLN